MSGRCNADPQRDIEPYLTQAEIRSGAEPLFDLDQGDYQNRPVPRDFDSGGAADYLNCAEGGGANNKGIPAGDIQD
jgi:hypothetical protein